MPRPRRTRDSAPHAAPSHTCGPAVGPVVCVLRDSFAERWQVRRVGETGVALAAEVVLVQPRTVLSAMLRTAWETGNPRARDHAWVEGVEVAELPVGAHKARTVAFDVGLGCWLVDGLPSAVFPEDGVLRCTEDGEILLCTAA